MLVETTAGVIDTDHLRDHIYQIGVLLPYSLSREVVALIETDQDLSARVEDLERELEMESKRLEWARQARDKAQRLIMKLVDECEGPNLIEALEYIHDTLADV